MTVQQLKNSILQTAVQGKLVPQNPDDEPASVLLGRIRSEKERMVKEGKIKREKNPSTIFRGSDNKFYEKIGNGEPVCIQDKIPFDIPDNWEWARLSSIVFNHGQKIPASDFCYIDIGSIDNVNHRLNENETIIVAGKAPSRARKIVETNDILYSTVRPYLHNMCIINREFSHEPIASTGFAVLACFSGIYNEFLFYYMMAPIFDSYANHADNSKGIAYPAINDDRLYRALIPIPPISEQKRIVAKLNEVLPYLDRYDEQSDVLSSLDGNFPSKLQNSILQTAVQGKLVPQNPDDEPASVLLGRIRSEKERMVKEGKIKREKNPSTIFRGSDNKFYEKIGNGEPVCIQDKIPFDIPDSWEWVRVKNFCTDVFSGRSPKYEKVASEYRIIGQAANQQGGINYGEVKYTNPAFWESMPRKYFLKKNDVLLNTLGNGTLGRSGIVKSLPFEMLTDGHLFVFRHLDSASSMYFYYYLQNIQDNIIKAGNGSTNQTFLCLNETLGWLIPVPPLLEQKRIVAKLNEILSLLDENDLKRH